MRAARRVCGAVAAFTGVVVVASLVGERGPLADADHAAFAAVRARRSPPGVAAARGISALAEPGVAYPATVLAGIVASRRLGWRRAWVPLLVVAGGAVVRRRVSRVIARPRPPAAAWLAEPEGFSLPSKHTTLAALTAGACVQAAGGHGRWYAVPVLVAAAVGGSRVYLGVHWPGDVLAGWLFAAGWLRLTGPGTT
jgi:undecaprenyl-diphosphatase